MANELVSFLHPRLFVPEGLDQLPYLLPAGDLRGLPLKKVPLGYTAVGQVPGSLTVATGLTFTLLLTDDGTNAGDLGLVVRVGITVKRLVNDETTDLDAGASAEATVDVTLSATAGGIVVATKAVANAALDSLATGEFFAVRVRRVSTASQDTCPGVAILLGVSVKNT